MPLFGKNKHESSPTETGQNVDDTINGIPRDGGFGEKQLRKYDNNHPEFMESNANQNNNSGNQYPTGNPNSGTAQAAYREEERFMDEQNGPGMGSGGNMNDPAMAQHHRHHHQQHNAAMAGGGGATMANQDPYANNANVNPNASDPYGNNTMSQGGGGGGGFISNQHANRLGQDAETRRQQQGQGFTGQGGNRAEYDAMGFDTPSSSSNNTTTTGGGGYGGNTNSNTTTTGMGSNSMGGGSGGANVGPHNSLSLKQQADMKAREGEAMQKQAVEVSKAEQLEKQALAARQRAVDHGAHPLHGQIGGVDGARGNQA